MLHQDRERAEIFGRVADVYDRSRPDYPPAALDLVLEHQPPSALDVGTGTGKLARLLCERGVAVTGVEPDERMAARARSHGLTVETAVFETWAPAGRRWPLVTAGQSWHWIDPVAGMAKAAEVLEPGGVWACLWNFDRVEDDASLAAVLDAAYAHHAPGVDRLNVLEVEPDEPDEPADDDEVVLAAAAAGAFGPVTEDIVYWEESIPIDRYIERISTQSSHLLLADDQRAALLAAVTAILEPAGPMLVRRHGTLVVRARRR